MKKNLLKEKIKNGGVGAGCLMREPALNTIEILGLLGFDYINIDCQHSPMSVETVAQMVRAAEIRGLTPLSRVDQNVPEIILRYMDVGLMGIIVADLDNPEIAKKAVNAVKYPPEGQRGLSAVRAADYGLTEPLSQYVKTANAETMVLGVVESREGVENIEGILATEGLDGVIIGTTDLSKSYGVPGERNHPLILEAVEKILATVEKTGKILAGSVRKGESPQKYIDKGYRMVSIGLESLISGAAKQYIENMRGGA